MRAVGIVCEYNPFHKGHLYQIEALRQSVGEDAAVVCAMSGDFVQRGEAAVFDKFARAEAACRCGASLVLELPLPWCLSSAEGFAFGAVSLLSAVGCDTISFGSESGDTSALKMLAAFAADEAAQAHIHALMDGDAALSFARARQLAAAEALGGEAAAMLSAPNDILAVEYLKAIRKIGAAMEPLPIRRTGAAHDSIEDGKYVSAMRLRAMQQNGEAIDGYIPRPAMEVFQRELAAGRSRNEKLLEIALLSRLYALKRAEFDRLPDAGGGAGRRLFKALQEGGSLDQIAESASSKRYTTARMRRMLLCAALGICAEDTKGTPPYMRILAASEKGRTCLSRLRDNSTIPPVNRASEVKKLDWRTNRIFSLGADAHELYRLQFAADGERKRYVDWKTGAVIV